MESENNTSPLHSYPNADRPIGEKEVTAGPTNPAGEKPLVHIKDALKAKLGSEDSTAIKTIRTYQSDVANAVRSDNISLIKISLAEKKRQEQKGTPEEIQNNSKRTLIIGAGAAILILGGIIAIVFGYAGGKLFNTVPSVGTSSAQSPLFFQTEADATVNVTGEDALSIKRDVQNERQKPLSLGFIKRVNFIESNGTSSENVSTTELFNKLNAGAPDSLVRTLSPNYLFGIYSYNTPKDTFLLVNVDSYDQAYAGMISWENTLKSTVGALFIGPATSSTPAQTATTGTTSTSTAAASSTGTPGNTAGNTAIFIDRVINNRDARVLVDGQGNTEMLYSFLDQHTLLIASSEAMLKEIGARLTTGLIVR